MNITDIYILNSRPKHRQEVLFLSEMSKMHMTQMSR